jgi:hypothetical protein
MQNDEALCHESARGVDHFQRPLGANIGLHDLDHPVADPDVAHTAQTRVEDVAALDEQIERVGPAMLDGRSRMVPASKRIAPQLFLHAPAHHAPAHECL